MLYQGQNVERIGPCHKCGKRADYNSPKVDPRLDLQTAPIWCDDCSRESPDYLIAIEQCTYDGKRRMHKGGYMSVCKRGVHAMLTPEGDRITSAWFEGGSIAIPREKFPNLPVEEALDSLADTWEQGFFFCTSCTEKFPHEEMAGRPLFAGAVCAADWEKHKKHLEDQKQKGLVCRMCREPYDNCCC